MRSCLSRCICLLTPKLSMFLSMLACWPQPRLSPCCVAQLSLHALQAWLYFVLLVYNYWVQVRHLPYYHTWINCVFAFSSCTYAWGAFLLLVATYVRAHWDAFTIAFYCGAVLSVASVGLVCLRYALLCFCKRHGQHPLLPPRIILADLILQATCIADAEILISSIRRQVGD